VPASRLSCAACEEQIAELLDGLLAPAVRTEVEAHLAFCAACAELARDAGGAMQLMGRASSVEVPATLVPQILAEITVGPSRVLVRASLAERIFGRWIRPVQQPRFALGSAMAALSFAVIPWGWLPAAEESAKILAPVKVLTIAENRIYRTFDRALKSYDDLTLVADVQNQIDEWQDRSWDQGDRAAVSEGARQQ
jgi:anti-sigma factor RsiW